MKCALCKNKIDETFLKKIVGTFVKKKGGKPKPVCNTCQKTLTIDELREKI